MAPLEALQEPLEFAWLTVSHLMGVQNSDALRAAHDAVQPDVVSFSLRLGQSQPIYEGMKAMRGSDVRGSLSGAQQRILESSIRDAELSGIALKGHERDQFQENQKQLAELGSRFKNNVLDATRAFALTITDPADAEGFPATLLGISAQSARDAGDDENATAQNGPWRITLDAPVLIPFLEHCRQPALREHVYRAHITRAASGDFDNGPLIDQILQRRYDQAKLLGYQTPAEVSLARKMASGVDAIDQLSRSLTDACMPAASRDLDELTEYARECTGNAGLELAHWDIAFWAERLREDRYAYREEDIRPYFSLDRVLDGLFELAGRLFGITITPADGAVPVWHPDVRYFRVAARDGSPVAGFYLDPYSRPADKRGGAWMGECLSRQRLPDGGICLPVTWLVCNQTSPVGDTPSLMSFDEIRTLFHEFGHGLQHMLTTVEIASAAGINNIEWDAIEIASQFMENWCYHKQTLLGMSRHVESGAPLPDGLYDKIVASRVYRTGSTTLRQLYFGILDIELHHRYQPGGPETVEALKNRVAGTATLMHPLPEDRFLCSFSHIFGGGYAAGYYSYKWSEVLSADAFSAFEEAGLDNADAITRTGARFRDTILSEGGSRHPMDVYRDFRGREPTIDALLRHTGLATSA